MKTTINNYKIPERIIEKENKVKIKYKYSSYFLYLMFFILWGYVIYLLWPIKVFDFLNDPAPILQKQVKANELIQYKLNRVKHLDVPTEITYQFINREAYFIPYVFLTHQALGVRNTIVSIQVPPLSPDTYKIRITVRSKLPFFKTIIDSFETEEFMIIE